MSQGSRIDVIENYYSEKLKNKRNLYIYIPEGYDSEPDKRYPVLYMHDGQSIFDCAGDSLSGASWHVNRVADKLIRERKICKLIIVGISNSRSRASEYIHRSCVDKVVENSSFGEYKLNAEASGYAYEEFLIGQLMPFINARYRTLTDPQNTAMIGSSMGGLVTYNIGMRNQNVFGKIGVMSPAFFWDDPEYLKPQEKKNLKIWMDVGGGEPDYVCRTENVVKEFYKAGYLFERDFLYYREPMGIHTEETWGKRVFMSLLYFFGEIGNPVSMELKGIEDLPLNSNIGSLNCLVTYESGVIASNLSADYFVENREILQIEPDGRITTKTNGETGIYCTYDSLTAKKQISVSDLYQEKVTITVYVKVPEKTPENSSVYFGSFTKMPFKLDRVDGRIYKGEFQAERGDVITFRLRREENTFGSGDRTAEVGADGEQVGVRQILADGDKILFLEVKNWRDTV